MITNKVIAEKINVFLNLLFHLEDYINNQKIREEQLHISESVKSLLSEVAYSEIVKDYFYKGADVNLEHEEKETEPEFKIMKLTEEKKRYIKMVNPQSFNQKNLELINFFFNSTGEADLINDLIKYKVLSTIKFCLTEIMLKKFRQKQKEIYSKINFVLISRNGNKELKQNKCKIDLFKKQRSLADMSYHLKLRPNFIIAPEPSFINTGKIKKRNNVFNNKKCCSVKKRDDNIKNSLDYYYKIIYSKNNKLLQRDSKDKNNDHLPSIKPNKTHIKVDIPPSAQLDLIDLLHNKRFNSKFKKKYKITKKRKY